MTSLPWFVGLQSRAGVSALFQKQWQLITSISLRNQALDTMVDNSSVGSPLSNRNSFHYTRKVIILVPYKTIFESSNHRHVSSVIMQSRKLDRRGATSCAHTWCKHELQSLTTLIKIQQNPNGAALEIWSRTFYVNHRHLLVCAIGWLFTVVKSTTICLGAP